MMSIVNPLRYAQAAEIAVATFAIDKGTQLFFSRFNDLLPEENANEQIMNIVFVESHGNPKQNKSSKATNYIQNICQQLKSLTEVADSALKEIENIKTIIQTSDFQQSLDYLSDAWRALSGKNIPLFKSKINKTYDCARAAKTKITKNPNHLLGVYSIIIFTGFCQFSNFGDDIILGLQHIKDTLIQLNSERLLIKYLKSITSAKLYWDKDQKIFLENVLLFAVKVRSLVHHFIQYALRTHGTNRNGNDDMKLQQEGAVMYHEEFGDVIASLFPNAMIDMQQNSQKCHALLDYRSWCPNVFDGRYFGGGDKAKVFDAIDFFTNVYKYIFTKKSLKNKRIFIHIFANELARYLRDNAEANDYLKTAIHDADTHGVCTHLHSGLNGKTKISLLLALQGKIDETTHDSSHSTTQWDTPHKVIFTDYHYKFDIILISPFVCIRSITLDGATHDVIYRLSFLLKYERSRQPLFSLEEFKLTNLIVPLKCLNVLLIVLDEVCCLDRITMDHVKVQCDPNVNYSEMWNDGFNLQFIPKSVATIHYDHVETQIINTIDNLETKQDDIGCNEEDVMLNTLDHLFQTKLKETLPHLNRVCIENIEMNADGLNSLLKALSCACNNIKILQLKCLSIQHNVKRSIDWDDDRCFVTEFDLASIPKSIEIFEYVNITHMQMKDGFDFIGVDDIVRSNSDDTDGQSDACLLKFVCSKEDRLNSLRSIKMDHTVIGNINLRTLVCDFIAKQCIHLEELSVSDCGLNDESCRIIVSFYENADNIQHRLGTWKLDYSSEKYQIFARHKNKISNRGIAEFVSILSDLKHRNDVEIYLENDIETLEMRTIYGNIDRIKTTK
eukprot:282926_1